MYSLPSAPENEGKKCRVTIENTSFREGPPKQVEVEIENLGNADCSMKEEISIRPSTKPDWTEISVVWEPLLVQPGATSKINFAYEWARGLTYFIKVMTEKGIETVAYGKAP